MKGTMSELELSILRARSMEALKQKARRGELFFTVAVGYVKVGRDKIEMDPDLRVREAIRLVFTRFAEMQSIRQVFLSLRAERITLPYSNNKSPGQPQILWKLPVYATVNNFLTNPVYAGAYAFGRSHASRRAAKVRRHQIRISRPLCFNNLARWALCRGIGADCGARLHGGDRGCRAVPADARYRGLSRADAEALSVGRDRRHAGHLAARRRDGAAL